MGFVGWIKSMNVVRLKWIAILTYFGVYGLLFFDIHVTVNDYLVHLPATIRPPPLEPVWEVMDLPKSVSMGLFSLGVTALVLSAVVVRSAWRTFIGGRGRRGLEREADGPDEPTTVGWNAGDGGKPEGGRQTFDHERYNLRVTGRQNHVAGRPNYHGSRSGGPDGDRSSGSYRDRTESDRGGTDRGGSERGGSERDEPLGAEAGEMTARVVAGRAESSRGNQQADGPTIEDGDAWPEEWVSGSDL